MRGLPLLRTLCRIAFLSALVVISAGALLGERQLGFSVDGFDKAAHLGAFLVLALLGALGWPHFRDGFLICLPVFGVALEAAQTLTPAREFSWADAVMNGAGVGIGVTIAALLVSWLEAPRAR